MSTIHILPRDAANSDTGSSITASAVTKGCKPVATWLKLCPHDFAAVVGIIFFVCYVLWGIPLTVRLFTSCKSVLYRLRYGSKSYSDPSSVYLKDFEEGNDPDFDDGFEYAYMDPYHSPTPQLRDFLSRSSYVLVPAPTASPKDKLTSQPSPSPNMDDILTAKTRLARFQFPPTSTALHQRHSPDASDVFRVSMYSQTDTIVEARHAHKSTIDELDDLVFKSEHRNSYSSYSCSTPYGNNRRRSSGSSSFVMFDLNSYKSSDDLLEDSCVVDHIDLPPSPPPAYLDQRSNFVSSAPFANVAL
ncbi:hypothetical protein NM688_g8336 [Phlebia brevispora]|uniref:Uncharacterized protein n=1 Tax=Phlebia brevispora TaxID=194682 RepID=A0ACC1RTQ4_9APHY|nr:hypothetical protein NM688_g8336 [Phlebia brevispora]